MEEYQVQVKILPTPAGKELQNFMDKFGTKALVVCPIGTGTLKRRDDGVDEVENYSISSFSLELKSHMEGSDVILPTGRAKKKVANNPPNKK